MSDGDASRHPDAPPPDDGFTVPGSGEAPLPAIPEVTLHCEIARGGMGVVYRGRQDFLDRDVAVKLLAPHLQGEQFAARFRREAKILAGIKHPNIVGCHMAGTTSAGRSYLVMEFVDGPSLKTWIAEHGELALPAALRLVRQLASALGHAADLGVIHRDVKPENILLEAPTSTSLDLSFPYMPKLVDLGLARMTHESADLGLTAPGSVMGTPVTMAPEQFDAPDSVDFRADIYGLGCVLYQMLTGVPAFEGTQLTEIVVEKRRPEGPDPCDRRADIPAAVGQLVATMLANDRADRPASYRELIARLDEHLAAIARGSAPQKRAGRGKRDNPKLLQTAEFEFLAAGGGIGGGTNGDPADFPDPTGVHPRVASDQAGSERALAAPSPAATPGERRSPRVAAGAATPASVAAPPRRRGHRRLLVGVVATAVVLAAAVGIKRHRKKGASPPGQRPAATAPSAGDQRPRRVAIRGLDGAVRPDVPIELRAEAPGSDRGDLRYRWTVQPDAGTSLEEPAASSTVLRLDGLPGDEFAVGLEVSDGSGEPIQVVRDVVLDYEPVDLFADFLARDTEWSYRGRLRGEWTRREEDGAVSCAARNFPGYRSRAIPGRVWRVVGQLLPERQNERAFAQTAVCLRIGSARALALVCEREGASGELWSLSLQEVDREDGRAGFTFRPLAGQPKTVMVVDEDRKLTSASYSITRRGNELTFSFGFPDIDELAEHRERVRSNVENVMLSLVARGGRGVYPKLELW